MAKRWIGWTIAAALAVVLLALVLVRPAAVSSTSQGSDTPTVTGKGPSTALPTVYEFATHT